jgi:hypothetical protein
LPLRSVTAAEADKYLNQGVCKDILMVATGERLPSYPEWRDKTDYVPSTCHSTDIEDGGYKLVCCKASDREAAMRILGPAQTFVTPTLTPEQLAEQAAEQERIIQEQEAQLIAAAEPQYGFFQRYWLFLLLGLGTVGAGVTAGLISRAKKEKE